MPKPVIHTWLCEGCSREYTSEAKARLCEDRHLRLKQDDAWIILMTSRSAVLNAVVCVLGHKDERVFDLKDARIFREREIADWMGKESTKYIGWLCTPASLKGSGVPPLPWEAGKAGSGGARRSEGKNP